MAVRLEHQNYSVRNTTAYALTIVGYIVIGLGGAASGYIWWYFNTPYAIGIAIGSFVSSLVSGLLLIAIGGILQNTSDMTRLLEIQIDLLRSDSGEKQKQPASKVNGLLEKPSQAGQSTHGSPEWNIFTIEK